MKKTSKRTCVLHISLLILFGLAVFAYLLLPVGFGLFASIHQPDAVPDPPDGFDNITLTAADGVDIAAWTHESQNGASIILVHGSGGSRASVSGYARLLADNGYGVIAIDMRGHGESGGSANAFAWNAVQDIRAAADYLQNREDTASIGALGISLGGEVLLSASADLPCIQAIASDGATHRSTDDYISLPKNNSLVRSWTTRVMYSSVQFFTGQYPPDMTIADAVTSAQNTRFLFIAAGNVPDEIIYNTMFHETIKDRSSLWVADNAGHTQAYHLYPEDYVERITSFFDTVLLESS